MELLRILQFLDLVLPELVGFAVFLAEHPTFLPPSLFVRASNHYWELNSGPPNRFGIKHVKKKKPGGSLHFPFLLLSMLDNVDPFAFMFDPSYTFLYQVASSNNFAETIVMSYRFKYIFSI